MCHVSPSPTLSFPPAACSFRLSPWPLSARALCGHTPCLGVLLLQAQTGAVLEHSPLSTKMLSRPSTMLSPDCKLSLSCIPPPPQHRRAVWHLPCPGLKALLSTNSRPLLPAGPGGVRSGAQPPARECDSGQHHRVCPGRLRLQLRAHRCSHAWPG